MGEEVRELTASLGYERTQDLVGRTDLLVQARGTDRVDVAELIKPVEEMLDLEPLELPLPPDERAAPGLVLSRPLGMRPKDREGDRVHGAEAAGELARQRIAGTGPEATEDTLTELELEEGTVGGQGLGAFNVHGIDITVEGGAQDGVAKAMLGGKVAVLKGTNRLGSGSTARWASPSPTAHSAGGCSCRATPTRASASASAAPTWCRAASPPSRWTTHAGAWPTAPT